MVAPFTGAWIEIEKLLALLIESGVAPFTGAWIEIALPIVRGAWSKSHPSRVRGLKYQNYQDHILLNKSHPSRVRGLKF